MLNPTNHQQLKENGNSSSNTTNSTTTTTTTNSSSIINTLVSKRRRNKRKAHFNCSKSSSSSFSSSASTSTAASDDGGEVDEELETESSEMEGNVLNLSQHRHDPNDGGSNYVAASFVTSMLTDATWLQFYDDLLRRVQHNGAATAVNTATIDSIVQNGENAKTVKCSKNIHDSQSPRQQKHYNIEPMAQEDETSALLTEIKVEEQPTVSGGGDNSNNSSSNDNATTMRSRLKRSANKFKRKTKRQKIHDDDKTKLKDEPKNESDENVKSAKSSDDDENEDDDYDEFLLKAPEIQASYAFQQQQYTDDAESAYSDSSYAGNSTSRANSLRNVEAYFDSAVIRQSQSDIATGTDTPEGTHEDVAGVKQKSFFVEDDIYQHLIKYASYLDCKNDSCRLKNLRDHLHCYELPCLGKALSRKEDFVRHVKWHRKRNKSLAYGFLRYSANDDCTRITDGIGGDEDVNHQPSWTAMVTTCQYNRKQTHYHCAQPNCARVYVSTSDVQMHANYHKKASAIKREGFQRFRANDDCKAKFCMFIGQQTTHFHCCRANCQFTFKHKADMEKHKAYHLKDLQFARDGFKRYLKNEPCPFSLCRFSGVCNHIHCARDNCGYVLHSSGQMLSHKRKHERMDSEQANSRYKLLTVKLAALMAAAATAAVNSDEATTPHDNDSVTTAAAGAELSKTLAAAATLERFQKLLQQQQTQNLLPVAAATPTVTTTVESVTIPTSNVDATATAPMQITTIDGFFNRKRGRPPKNRFVEVYKNTQPTPQAIFTSFKLEKQSNNNSGNILLPINDNSSTTSTAVTPAAATNVLADATKTTDFDKKRYRQLQQQHQQQKYTKIFTQDGEDNNSDGVENTQAHELPATTTNGSTTTTTTTIICAQQQQPSVDNKNTSPAYSVDSDNNRYCPPPPTHAYMATTSCDGCTLMSQQHYHCRCDDDQCTYVTISRDALSLHMEHLHTASSFANTINQRYARYDRAIGLDCGIADCRLRKARPHLHCKKCLHQISPFDLESHECTIVPTPTPTSPARTTSAPSSIPHIQLQSFYDISKSTTTSAATFVRAAGTFYPENSIDSSNSCGDNNTSALATAPAAQQSQQTEDGNTCSRPFCKMKRKPHAHCEICAQAFASAQKARLHRQKQHSHRCSSSSSYSTDMPQDLSLTPKNKHANRCRQLLPTPTESPPPSITPLPMSKQHSFTASNLHDTAAVSIRSNELAPFISYYQQQQHMAVVPPAPPPTFAAAIYAHLYPFGQTLPERSEAQYPPPAALLGMPPGVSSDITSAAVFLGALPTSTRQEMFGLVSNNMRTTSELSTQPPVVNAASYRSSSQPSFKLKDDRIPVGYLKFRFNEDCCFPKCGYRNHQSHFHCDRNDCHYSFCDKTRFVQHTARHERLDTLMGEDFRQYRANMNCGYENCAYFKNLGPCNKSSHFHCLKCSFICSDTNKVVAHRRQHSKMEYIRLAGFRKVASNESCSVDRNSTTSKPAASMETCIYSMKQTHYHCLVCDCSVLSRAQLTSHRHRITTISTTTTTVTASTTSIT